MRIVTCNNRYFPSSGPERYMFAIQRALVEGGHDVIPFAADYGRSLDTPHRRFFAEPPLGPDQLYFDDYRTKIGPRLAARALGKAVYNLEARRRLARLIDETRPDIVYVLNVANVLSLSVIDAARSRGVPVAMRLSDFGFACARYTFLREGRVCEDCLGGRYYRGLLHRCVKGSRAASLARVAALYAAAAMRQYEKVDAFVAPSAFMRAAMAKAGFAQDKIHHLPSPVERPGAASETPAAAGDPYAVYFGRIAEEKGLGVLLEAMGRADRGRLLVIGDPGQGEGRRLQGTVQDRGLQNVRFEGELHGPDLWDRVAGSTFSVLPALWFENTPMSVYESMALGVPVIASDIGSLPEQIADGITGFLVPPGDAAALADRMNALFSDPEAARRMGEAAREHVSEMTAQAHCSALLAVFEDLIERGGRD